MINKDKTTQKPPRMQRDLSWFYVEKYKELLENEPLWLLGCML